MTTTASGPLRAGPAKPAADPPCLWMSGVSEGSALLLGLPPAGCTTSPRSTPRSTLLLSPCRMGWGPAMWTQDARPQSSPGLLSGCPGSGWPLTLEQWTSCLPGGHASHSRVRFLPLRGAVSTQQLPSARARHRLDSGGRLELPGKGATSSQALGAAGNSPRNVASPGATEGLEGSRTCLGRRRAGRVPGKRQAGLPAVPGARTDDTWQPAPSAAAEQPGQWVRRRRR